MKSQQRMMMMLPQWRIISVFAYNNNNAPPQHTQKKMKQAFKKTKPNRFRSFLRWPPRDEDAASLLINDNGAMQIAKSIHERGY